MAGHVTLLRHSFVPVQNPRGNSSDSEQTSQLLQPGAAPPQDEAHPRFSRAHLKRHKALPREPSSSAADLPLQPDSKEERKKVEKAPPAPWHPPLGAPKLPEGAVWDKVPMHKREEVPGGEKGKYWWAKRWRKARCEECAEVITDLLKVLSLLGRSRAHLSTYLHEGCYEQLLCGLLRLGRASQLQYFKRVGDPSLLY